GRRGDADAPGQGGRGGAGRAGVRQSTHRRGAAFHRRAVAGLRDFSMQGVKMRRRTAFLVFAALLSGVAQAAADDTIVVASTTSTQDSGLFSWLLPIVKLQTGITVKVLAQGTGQALDTARRGDADVVFVHDAEAEERFVAEGHGVKRYPVMYNDFLIAGPSADPARVRGGQDVVRALRAIAAGGHPFVSRGDRSGTHQAELGLWKAAGLEPQPAQHPWYRAVGQGMGPALNIAAATDAYVLVDRATWI